MLLNKHFELDDWFQFSDLLAAEGSRRRRDWRIAPAMPPKAGKPKAGAKNAPKAVAAPAPALALAPGFGDGGAAVVEAKPLAMVQDVNREHLQSLEEALQVIYAHPLFANVMQEGPRKIDAGAVSTEAGAQAWFPKVGLKICWQG